VLIRHSGTMGLILCAWTTDRSENLQVVMSVEHRQLTSALWSQPVAATLDLRGKTLSAGWNGDFAEVVLRQRRRRYGITGSMGESLKPIRRAFGKQSSPIYFLVIRMRESS
jgi:hypothetical protein